MKNSLKLVSVLLIAILLFSLLPTSFAAGSETPTLTVEPAETEPVPELTFLEPEPVSGEGENYGRTPLTVPARSGSRAKTRSAAALPAVYTSAYSTPVRSQGNYGSCWAHAAVACVEANMVKKGLTVDGAVADAQTLNLSESHLAWFTYSAAYDALGMLTGDTCSVSDYRNRGGNGQVATMALMRWAGPASESIPALAYDNMPAGGIDAQYAYAADVGHVQDVLWIPTQDRDAVKQAIMDYGVGTLSYYSADAYEDPTTGATYCYTTGTGTNHDVTVIGWDDNYPKENFTTQPPGDGAWLIKNSWGTRYNTLGGYFYLSYYDKSSVGTDEHPGYCFFYNVEAADNYDSNYQYDGTSQPGAALPLNAGYSFGNVFTANGTELLEAVSLCHSTPDLSYTLRIYVDVETTPGTGRKVAEQTGTLPYAGYQTVRLNEPVQLTEGQKFAVVFETERAVDVVVDVSGGYYTHVDHPNCSFWSNGYAWYATSGYNLRIKAYTTGNTPACLHANTETRNFVASTCTGTGYSGDVYCLDSGEKIYSGTVTQPTGHTFSAYGVCSVCGQRMKFDSGSLKLDENIDLLFTVTIPDGFIATWMEFTLNGTTVRVSDYTELGNQQYRFECSDVPPQCMGDSVSAALRMQFGMYTYTLTYNYSIKTYCSGKLANKTLRTLSSDLLAYGAAAQIYAGYKTDSLVTNGLGTNYKPSTFPGLEGKSVSFTGTQDASTYWTNASLVLKNDVAARFGFVTDDVSGLTVEVSINGRTRLYTASEFGTDNGSCYITFDGIKATEFDDTVTARFLRGGEQIGAAVHYSVNAYICAKQNDADPNLRELVRTLYNYGASAKAYAAAVG